MFFRCAVGCLCLAAWQLYAQPAQTTLKLIDGGSVIGRVVTFNDQGIRVALEGGGENPVYTNVFWSRLTQETLQQLTANQQAKPFATIFIDPPGERRPAERKIKAVVPPRLDRPQAGSLFSSPVMLVLLLLIYAANIYAGFEIAVFRQWPPYLVAALSAVLPFIGPVIFLSMPTKRPKVEAAYEAAPPAVEEAPVAVAEEAPAAAEHAPAQPAIAPPVVYPRGQFTFNRRFFETKFAGFLKMVPGESERDKVIHIKSARGEYTGQRLSKIDANELVLQIRKGTATEDVMIPFSEIYEVTVKHKDT